MCRLHENMLQNGIWAIATRGKFPPRGFGLGFGSRSGLVLGLGGQPYNCSRRTFSPVTARVWLRVSFKVGGQFSSGEIVLKPTK